MEILEQSLGRVEAPAELWDRIARAPVRRGRGSLRWGLAACAAAAVMAVMMYRPALRSDDPAVVREWVKARTGMDVPLARENKVRLMGARVVRAGRVEISYRVGERTGSMLISEAATGAHWGAYAIACEAPACALCHS